MLADNGISDRALQLISEAPLMINLEELILYGNTDITGEGLYHLSQSNFIKKLKNVDLHATSVDDAGMHHWMKS
jgi:hypothetical protein